MGSRWQPKLSIVTVVKDDNIGLAITAKSILAQEGNKFEWVIVDSSSDSKTNELLQSLRRYKWIHIYYEKPAGIYSAMNFGAEKSTGDFLWFVNAGDFFLGTQSVSSAIALAARNSSASLIGTTVIQSTRNGYLYSYSPASIEYLDRYKMANFHHQGSLIRKNHFFLAGKYDTSLSLAADTKMLDHLAAEHLIVSCHDAFVGFKLGGRSGQNFRKTMTEIQTYRPIVLSKLKIEVLVFKNSMRFKLLRFEDYKLISYYLLLRQRKFAKILSDLNISSPNFTLKWNSPEGLFRDNLIVDTREAKNE